MSYLDAIYQGKRILLYGFWERKEFKKMFRLKLKFNEVKSFEQHGVELELTQIQPGVVKVIRPDNSFYYCWIYRNQQHEMERMQKGLSPQEA